MKQPDGFSNMKLPEPKTQIEFPIFQLAAPKVAVVKTTPQTVLEDMQRAMELAGIRMH
jgi:hypothetical protein